MHKDQLDLRGKITHLAYEIHQLSLSVRLVEDHILKDQILEIVERKSAELQTLTRKL